MNLSRVCHLQRLLDSPVLISHPDDVFYYANLQPGVDDHPLLLVPEKGKPTLFVSPLTGKIPTPATVKDYRRNLHLPKKLGYDETHLPTGLFLKLKKSHKLTPLSKIIKKPREVKSAEEITLMKKAIAINKKVLRSVSVLGKSEKDVARDIERGFLDQGADRAFETIVSSGENAGRYIHHFPSSKKVKRGEMVIIDFGSRWRGYSSDITRTFFDKNNPKQAKIVETVSQIQQACIDLVRPGVEFKEIDTFHRKALKKRGFKARHGIGHGIGLFVHEPATVLEKGMVITIEPGIYQGSFGCRIEDQILVKNRPVVLSSSIPQASR